MGILRNYLRQWREKRDGTLSGPALETEDIPLSSWQKWALRNWALTDGHTFDAHWPSINKRRTVSGSGDISTFPDRVVADTGSTSGSTAQAASTYDKSTMKPVPSFDNRWLFRMPVRLVDDAAGRIDYFSVGDGGVSAGNAGFGFKVASQALHGVVHDGTAETTAKLVDLPSNFSQKLLLTADYDAPNGEVTFTIDGTEEGALSTGLPPGTISGDLTIESYTENTTANQRRTWYNQTRVAELP